MNVNTVEKRYINEQQKVFNNIILLNTKYGIL